MAQTPIGSGACTMGPTDDGPTSTTCESLHRVKQGSDAAGEQQF